MMTQEENKLLTQTGRGTPAGELLRRYWQPIALSEELPPGAAPLSIKILFTAPIEERISAMGELRTGDSGVSITVGSTMLKGDV